MIALIRLVLGIVASPFRSGARLEAENAALRQQLIMLLARPETLVRWNRAGFRRYWRWKSRCHMGRPAVDGELRELIRRMSRENLLWGAPRIHGELLKLGFQVAQSTVAKHMVKRRGPPSQGRKTFLRNHADGIVAIDLFVVPTIGFRTLYGLAIVRLAHRLLVWTAVTTNPTTEWIARQITEAFPWDDAPKYLVRDRDAVYGAAFKKRTHAMGVRDHPIAPRSPWQNPYAERLIGTIRRDCLDYVVLLGRAHLHHILRSYAAYYNQARTHRTLAKDCPIHRPIQALGTVFFKPVLGGLHHHYVRT